MKRKHLPSLLGICAVCFQVIAGSAYAQGMPEAPAGQNPTDYKIVKLTSLDKDYLQKADNVNGRASAKAKPWGVFDVSFMTQPKWIDELTITYTVMFQNRDVKDLPRGEKAISLFQTTVLYPMVEQGRDHKAGVVLPANFVQRYGQPIGFAVQFSCGGREVAAEGSGIGILKGREKWWMDSKIMDAPTVARRDGLVDRMKSPFQLVDIDLYEMSR